MKNFTALLTALALASAIPAELASAASFEITTTIQASLDKTIAGATQTQANRISSLYTEFLALQKQEQEWDAKINTLHSRNKDTSAELGNQAKEIDSAKLANWRRRSRERELGISHYYLNTPR